MKKKNILNLSVVLLCIIILISLFNVNIVFADILTNETIYQESVINESEGISLTSGVDNIGKGIFIQGDDDSDFSQNKPLTVFEEVKLISNANYFLINPKHYDSTLANNEKGACTTIAMQMLLGYHNYYSQDFNDPFL